MFEFTQASTGAAPLLHSLCIETFKEAYSDIHSLENIEAYCANNYAIEMIAAQLEDPASTCFIAYAKTSAAGFYLIKHHAPADSPLEGSGSELKQIYVRSDHYGSGLGRELLDHALAAMQADGVQWAWLCVSDENPRAQAFYKKHGFAPFGTGPILEVGTDRLTSTLLARPLNESILRSI